MEDHVSVHSEELSLAGGASSARGCVGRSSYVRDPDARRHWDRASTLPSLTERSIASETRSDGSARDLSGFSIKSFSSVASSYRGGGGGRLPMVSPIKHRRIAVPTIALTRS